MQKIKLNDEVIVLKGRSKGKTGKIARIDYKKKKVFLDGVNLAKKAMKPTQENPSGGIGDVEAPVHISNVALMSPKDNKPTRVRIEVKDGKKVRVAVRCGSVIKG